MNKQAPTGFVILDRKGEYIKDTIDQKGNTVFGLQNHPKAPERMVVVSNRNEFAQLKAENVIHDNLYPTFSLRDIDPTDLADWLSSLTPAQVDLVRDYAYVPDFYDKLLAETPLGSLDKSRWYTDFPGLFELNDAGKQIMKKIERTAAQEGRFEMTSAERDDLIENSGSGGRSHGVLERAAVRIKRFCLNPFFGGSIRAREILSVASCLSSIMEHLSAGRFVYIDMRGQADDDYTMIAALIARRLLNENKKRDDQDHIRACIVMEEAHNILSEAQVSKGDGRGSVFIELAREGRSFKLGFVLVTQQPDARSIAQQVVKTIDTVVAYNMQPDDANHLHRLKSQFSGLELQIANAREFQGVAVKDAGPIFFKAAPVTKKYMTFCCDGSLADKISSRGDQEPVAVTESVDAKPLSIENRLEALMRQRRESIRPIALATMRLWQGEETSSDSTD